MYDNWLFFTPFLFSPKKKREEEKENEVAKMVLNYFVQDPIDFHPFHEENITFIILQQQSAICKLHKSQKSYQKFFILNRWSFLNLILRTVLMTILKKIIDKICTINGKYNYMELNTI